MALYFSAYYSKSRSNAGYECQPFATRGGLSLTAYPQGTASTPELQFAEVAGKYSYIRLVLLTLLTTVSLIIVLSHHSASDHGHKAAELMK